VEHPGDRRVPPAFIAAFPDAVDVERQRDRIVRGFAELTRRAKESGRLRADFVPDDLALLLIANCGVTAEATPAASRRLVAYLLDAFRAEPTEPLPPPVPLNLHEILH
jgi:hypothetical protein